MAGRGTDIVLGGGDTANATAVAALGGLYVIGTNRHESRRIDDQLRGRAGRQGDPGILPLLHQPRRRLDPALRRDVADPGDAPADAAGRPRRRSDRRARDCARAADRGGSELRDSPHAVEVLGARRGAAAHRLRLAAVAAGGRSGSRTSARRGVRRALRDARGRGRAPTPSGTPNRRLLVRVLDDRWADHLALIEDVREGIHLQRYGGREPVMEFHRQIVDGFETLMADVRDETAERFERLRVGRRRDRPCRPPASAGRRPPGPTS